MKISYNWLKNYIDTDVNPENISEILTDTGLEIDGMEKIQTIKGGLEGLVVGEVLTKEKHPDADKLLKMTVDTGIDERTIVSGIAKHYKPEDIIGKQVSVLINLAPRKIRGIESQGMILMAEDNEGSLAFVSPEKVIDNGGIIS